MTSPAAASSSKIQKTASAGNVNSCLEGDAVTYTGMASAFEDCSNLVAPERVIHEWMHAHAVKQDRRSPMLCKRNIQASYQPGAIFISAVRNADIRADRQVSLVLQTLA